MTADTNVYISALNFGGVPDKILDLARAGEIHLSISSKIIDEMTRVLLQKFRWTREVVDLTTLRIEDFTHQFEPAQTLAVVKEDPTDNRILECAVAGASDYIITGDRHLLGLERFGSARIVKPADFLALQSKSQLGR